MEAERNPLNGDWLTGQPHHGFLTTTPNAVVEPVLANVIKEQ